jgi:hypothetical protein
MIPAQPQNKEQAKPKLKLNPKPVLVPAIAPAPTKKRGTRKLRIVGEPQPNAPPNAMTEYELNKCDNPVNNEDINGPCNKLLLEKEQNERAALASSQDTPTSYSYLYPSLNDNSFNEKITKKQEFNDTQYEGIKTEKDEDGKQVAMDVETYSQILSDAPFELQPHQAFVKNFLSLQTPYNSLLLYHGLGSGKTCSAIGVCEEQRDYLKQMGINKKIIIIAAPNVQDNFRLQLFDERKLVETDGLWNIRACTGNKMLKEINPTNLRMLTKEMIVKQINHLINTYYSFVGYIQFANLVDDIIAKVDAALGDSAALSEETRQKYINAQLNNEFNNSLIVIDEVHNIRIADENPRKSAAVNLMKLAHSVENLRFLLLSATPMYNNYAEIVWLLNLMNVNDKRAAVEIKQIFASDGQFLVDLSKPDGEQNVGERLFVQKCTGYVSFVRGENPYTFPFRIYPDLFAPPTNTFISASASAEDIEEETGAKHPKYPAYQMNNKPIDQDKPIIPIFLTNIGETQMYGYKCIINYLKREQMQLTNDALKFENMETFGYTILQKPIEALNMVYPVDGLKEYAKELEVAAAAAKEGAAIDAPVTPEQLKEYKGSPLVKEIEQELKEEKVREGLDVEGAEEETGKGEGNGNDQSGGEPVIRGILSSLTGKSGLKYAMQFEGAGDTSIKGNFEYRPRLLKKYGRIFSPDNIRYYSAKIAQICASIRTPTRDGVGFHVSKGIILIYSQYIDSGLIPVALALEELGFTRYGKDSKSLFKTAPPNTPVDVNTMLPRKGKEPFMPARYTMITGDKRLSKNNDADIKAITSINNKDGNIIKVVLISTAGSEGIDLKFIRQVHILDPWYNMNRIEQIIGRAVRNFSHKELPFNERNVEIFLHGTMLVGQDQVQEEAADLYVYRVAEMKAIQIGKISRLLKETAVDCVLNYEQTTLTRAHFEEMGQKPVQQLLSYYTDEEESIQYKVGDVPFSATCDYGQCEYKCLNLNEDGALEETPTPPPAEINRDTYNEKFIMSNAEKIVQKIKDIFSNKENGRHYFYKKAHLIKLINTPREFPDIQIYAAISQLIYDKSEYITDFYNRTGNLVNIGEYYLFHPAEFISNANPSAISSFDRTVPVDYKHVSININTEGREPQRGVHYAKDVHSFGTKFAEKEEKEDLLAAAADITPTKNADKAILNKIKKQYHIALQCMQEYSELEKSAPTPDELEEYSGYMKAQNLFRQGKSKENLSPLHNLKLKTLSAKINSFKKGIKQIVEPEEFTENDFVDLGSFQHKKEENKLSKNEKKQYAELQIKYDRAINLRLTMGDEEPNDSWFNYCGVALHKLQQIPFVAGANPNKPVMQKLIRYLIEHSVDVLLYSEKIRLLNALQSISSEDRDMLEDIAYNYMTRPPNKPEKVVKMGRRDFLILYDGKTQIEKNYDDDKRKLLVLNKQRWELANASANKDFNEEVERLKEDFKRENINNRINNIIGFIGYEKQGKQLLFKTKDITSDRNLVGARCDQTGKTELLKMLNILVGSRVFTEITTKLSGQQELCTMMEILFRYSHDIEAQGKLWFFSPELTELYYLEHCKIKNKKFICQQP